MSDGVSGSAPPGRGGDGGPGAAAESAPRAWFLPPGRYALLAAVPLILLTGWSVWHVLRLALGTPSGASGLSLVWLVTFALLWWLPVCWLERPYRLTDTAGLRLVEELRVTVQIPVYNEDPAALSACLDSVLAQTRPVQRVRVVNDGSADPRTGLPVEYAAERDAFLRRAAEAGVEATWDHTPNRGKRWAQIEVLAHDDADIFVTLDSDSVLEARAIAEGLKPFADPGTQSVAGLVTPSTPVPTR